MDTSVERLSGNQSISPTLIEELKVRVNPHLGNMKRGVRALSHNPRHKVSHRIRLLDDELRIRHIGGFVGVIHHRRPSCRELLLSLNLGKFDCVDCVNDLNQKRRGGSRGVVIHLLLGDVHSCSHGLGFVLMRKFRFQKFTLPASGW
jgi:hypothetical protein